MKSQITRRREQGSLSGRLRKASWKGWNFDWVLKATRDLHIHRWVVVEVQLVQSHGCETAVSAGVNSSV
mgnify:CR=1 FL=1